MHILVISSGYPLECRLDHKVMNEFKVLFKIQHLCETEVNYDLMGQYKRIKLSSSKRCTAFGNLYTKVL